MKLISVVLFSISLTACYGQGTVKDPTVDLNEGKLIYDVSGEGTTSSWTFEILFNPGNAVVKEQYAQGAGKKYIYDKKTNEILALIDGAAFSRTNSYFIYYTPQELIQLALSSNYGETVIRVTQEYKDILGYRCQKSIIKHGDQTVVEVWLTDKIKTGMIYPWTPLTFEKTALEYELRVLGRVQRKYVAKSISDERIDERAFEHSVPEQYYLVIPASVFSLDTLWTRSYKENTFKSFTYPYYNDGRVSTIQFIRNGLDEILTSQQDTRVSIDFLVMEDGTVSGIKVSINYDEEDGRVDQITKFLSTMNKWTPATVKGKPVKSRVTIFANVARKP